MADKILCVNEFVVFLLEQINKQKSSKCIKTLFTLAEIYVG